MQIHIVNKKLGQTPLEALNILRKRKKINPSLKLTYAGRLDPMATGALIILENSTQKEKEKIQNLDKVYQAQILFGLTSDSFDILGMPKFRRQKIITKNEIYKIVEKFTGSIRFPIPKFSSVPFKGKSLFKLAKSGLIFEDELPIRERKIKKMNITRFIKIDSSALLKYVFLSVKKVKGDFRQEKILNSWANLLKKHKQKFLIIEAVIDCESGTYVRSIANEIGKALGTGALVFKLNRLSVGKYIL